MARVVPTEADEARVLCDWMNMRGIWYVHIVNEGKRSLRNAAFLRRIGMMPGVPDYVILSHPRHRGTKPPVWLELKRLTGRPSKHQYNFINRLNDTGHTAKVCRGAEEAIDWLMELGY